MRRSPLLGYNHNVRYRDVVYHVQTEDSGPKYPRVTTHVYLNGVILATSRFEYNVQDPEEEVSERMQRQHKELLRQATQGRFFTSPTPLLPIPIVSSTTWQQTAEGIVFQP